MRQQANELVKVFEEIEQLEDKITKNKSWLLKSGIDDTDQVKAVRKELSEQQELIKLLNGKLASIQSEIGVIIFNKWMDIVLAAAK